jgi:catechol 2,3-dioxygenase-like lactoylglutathione lyase family enzyme
MRSWGIDHTGIGVSDIARSRVFYDAALDALGLTCVARIADETGEQAIGYGRGDYPVWWIDVFHPHSQRNHTAFVAKSFEQVRAFHEAALSAGGVDNGAPGPRDNYPATWRLAFVLDPDGNNIEAIWHGE